MPRGPIANALSFDLEDWYQITDFEHVVTRDRWPDCSGGRGPGGDRRQIPLAAHTAGRLESPRSG